MPEDTQTTETQDDPRTRRRRAAQSAYDTATALLAQAKVHLADQELVEALQELREAYRAQRSMELHARELRSDFHRKATLAIGDALLRDLGQAWGEALEQVSS